jgi:hypothetical protein
MQAGVVSMCLLASTAAKLEGAALSGDRSAAFAGVDDPVVLRQFGDFISDGMRRPVSAGCDKLPRFDALVAQRKGDRL